MHEAQQYPQDCDGIVIGARSCSCSCASLFPMGLGCHSAGQDHQPVGRQAKAVGGFVMAACDQLDGLKDGVIGRPGMCKVDPAVIQCKGTDSPDCLSAGQVSALRKIYIRPTNPLTGAHLSYGYLPGTELDFSTAATTPTSEPPFLSRSNGYGA